MTLVQLAIDRALSRSSQLPPSFATLTGCSASYGPHMPEIMSPGPKRGGGAANRLFAPERAR